MDFSDEKLPVSPVGGSQKWPLSEFTVEITTSYHSYKYAFKELGLRVLRL